MQNNRLMRLTKDLNAQHYVLCNLTAAEVKYIEKNHHRHGRLALTEENTGGLRVGMLLCVLQKYDKRNV